MKDLDKLITKQHQYFNTTITKEYKFRLIQLTKLYNAIYNYRLDIEKALYQDLKKPPFEAYTTEIGFVLKSINYAKKNLKKWMSAKIKIPPYYLFGSYDKVSYEPLGVSLIIGPFNYPFQLIIEPLIGAIVAGNCAIVKPSENAIETSKIIDKIIKETFEERYVACILGDVETTINLTKGKIDHIFFTGSSQVGKKIMATAAEQLIPVTLELGGKSPVIIDTSANLKDAVEKIVWGKIINAGQTCIAPDYLLIKEELKEDFIQLWKETVLKFLKKDDYARIINKKHFDRLVNLLENQIVYSGGNFKVNDLWIEPTLVEGKGSSFMNEEIFGPILPIITFNKINEIKIYVEKYSFPLAVYIFSNDKYFINYLTKHLSFGGGCVNDCITHLVSPFRYW